MMASASPLGRTFEGLRRLRVGRYRVVYEWQRSELLILVVRIGQVLYPRRQPHPFAQVEARRQVRRDKAVAHARPETDHVALLGLVPGAVGSLPA